MNDSSQVNTKDNNAPVVSIKLDVPDKILANNFSSTLSSQSRNTYQVQAVTDLHTIDNKVV